MNAFNGNFVLFPSISYDIFRRNCNLNEEFVSEERKKRANAQGREGGVCRAGRER